MAELKKRPDGRYLKRVYIGTKDGKKVYQSVYGATVEEVEQKAAAIRAQLNRERGVVATGTVREWCDAYLVDNKPFLTESEYKLKSARLDVVCERLGAKRIETVVRRDIQGLLNALYAENPHTGKESSDRTLTRYKRLIEAVFDYAVDNRGCTTNPARSCRVPAGAHHEERRALTLTEQEWICEFDHRGRLPMMLMMFAGLRRGEAAALLWSDVDLKHGEIRVSKSYDYKNKMVKLPKNGRPRTVTIPKILIDELRAAPRVSDHVVTSARGEPMSETAWRALLDSYLTDLNVHYGHHDDVSKFDSRGVPMVIPTWSYHCLRHTYATMLFEAGVDVLVARDQLGHSDITTTLRIYTELRDEHKAVNILHLDEFAARFRRSNGSQTTAKNVADAVVG